MGHSRPSGSLSFCRRTKVNVPEDESDLNEWKSQAVAAGLCAGFGLAGYFTPQPTWSVACYVISCLAGAWFAAQEAFEKLRTWTLDVHFLMLAVAAGSAARRDRVYCAKAILDILEAPARLTPGENT